MCEPRIPEAFVGIQMRMSEDANICSVILSKTRAVEVMVVKPTVLLLARATKQRIWIGGMYHHSAKIG